MTLAMHGLQAMMHALAYLLSIVLPILGGLAVGFDSRKRRALQIARILLSGRAPAETRPSDWVDDELRKATEGAVARMDPSKTGVAYDPSTGYIDPL